MTRNIKINLIPVLLGLTAVAIIIIAMIIKNTGTYSYW